MKTTTSGTANRWLDENITACFFGMATPLRHPKAPAPPSARPSFCAIIFGGSSCQPRLRVVPCCGDWERLEFVEFACMGLIDGYTPQDSSIGLILAVACHVSTAYQMLLRQPIDSTYATRSKQTTGCSRYHRLVLSLKMCQVYQRLTTGHS